MTLERIPLDEQSTHGVIRTIFESSGRLADLFRHRLGLMSIGCDECQPRFVKLVEADTAKKLKPMVAHSNRRFEVDGRIMQLIAKLILRSPKDIRPKR